MKPKVLIVAVAIASILLLTVTSYGWDGDQWDRISRDTITSIANEMIDSYWTPWHTIHNWAYGSVWYDFYSGTIYQGEAYCLKTTPDSWDEFFLLVNTTSGGNTTYGNDCSGFASISWRLPTRYVTRCFELDATTTGSFYCDVHGVWHTEDCCYSLGSIGSGGQGMLLRGDALNDDYNHIILFDHDVASGMISMEQTPGPRSSSTEMHRYWAWTSLNEYRPIRRNLIDNFPTVDYFDVTPLSVTLGDPFTISYTVSDDIGLYRVELWRANDSGGNPVGWDSIQIRYISGTNYSGFFSDAPSSVGTYWYGVHVKDNAGQWSVEPDPPGPTQVTVTALITINITVNPTSVDFGSVVVGQYKDTTITITNQPSSTGTLTGNVGNPLPPFYVLSGGGGFSLDPGQSKQVSVRFLPSSTGPFSGTLSISHNATNLPTPINVSLSGTGTEATPTIAYDPTSFSFTATEGGANPSDQYLSIWNSGGGTLNWTVSDNQPWLALSPTSGTNTGTVTVSVNIAGLDTGNYSAQITISALGATNSPQYVSVTLRINPSGTSIIMTVTPTSFNFGNVVIGQSADATIIIENDSGSTGTLNGNVGSLSTPFSVIIGGGSFSLPPPPPGGWSTSTQVVRFTPTSLGSFFASLTITHNATNLPSPLNVSLSGTGVEQPAGCQWEVTSTISLSGSQYLSHMAISNGKLYVGRYPNLLTVIDLSSNTPISNITFGSYTGCRPGHIAILGNRAYVALQNLGSNGQLAVVNTDNNSVDTYIPVGPDPWGVAAFGNRVYVTNCVQWVPGDSATGRVLVIDKGTNTILDTIYVEKNPNCIKVDPLTAKAYVTNGNISSRSVSVINTATNTVVKTIPVPNGQPNGVAITNNRAYVTKTIDEYPSAIEVINTTMDSIVHSIPVGRWPIAAATLNQYIFVTNSQSNNVTIIDTDSNTLVGTLNVGNWPYGIAVDPSSNKVYVGNHTDRTISILECAPTSVETSTELRPKEYALQQNYPNPFNLETVIEYTLSKGCHVQISIYNLVGQKVRTLVSEYQTAGEKKTIWDGRDDQGNELSSGIYFYRLKAGDFSQSKKMVLLR